MNEDRPSWNLGAGAHLHPAVLGGRLLATDAGAHGLAGCRAAVFELPGAGFVFVDCDRASNGTFLDVAVARDLDALEADLRARAAESSHPSAAFDRCDAEVLALARGALAAQAVA